MSGISPKLPLANNKVDGAYELNKTVKESVKQNLKNLLLTNPGERIMDPLFGLGLNKYLFEGFSSFLPGNIKSDMLFQVDKYMPFVEIIDFATEVGTPQFGEPDNLLKIKVEFLIKPLNETDILIINSDAN